MVRIWCEYGVNTREVTPYNSPVRHDCNKTVGHRSRDNATNKQTWVGGWVPERTRSDTAVSRAFADAQLPRGHDAASFTVQNAPEVRFCNGPSLTRRRGGYELGDLLDSPLSAHFSHISLRSALPTPSCLLRPQRRQASLSSKLARRCTHSSQLCSRNVGPKGPPASDAGTASNASR